MENLKQVEIEGYNSRRYARPWAARIKLNGAKADLLFLQGAYAGDDSGGTIAIETTPGRAYAWGQKDMRGNKSEVHYFGIDDNGTEIKFKNLGEARTFLFNQKDRN